MREKANILKREQEILVLHALHLLFAQHKILREQMKFLLQNFIARKNFLCKNCLQSATDILKIVVNFGTWAKISFTMLVFIAQISSLFH